jgi:hypothetical protein
LTRALAEAEAVFLVWAAGLVTVSAVVERLGRSVQFSVGRSLVIPVKNGHFREPRRSFRSWQPLELACF